MLQRSVQTFFGDVTLVEEDGAIVQLWWGRVPRGADSDLLIAAETQIAEYAAGTRETFDLPLRLSGSEFQQKVCRAISDIPFGETRSYGEIANALEVPAQAVGRACGGNPIPILIPCHRVLGADGQITGFSGGTGVETKVALLRHEGAAGLLI